MSDWVKFACNRGWASERTRTSTINGNGGYSWDDSSVMKERILPRMILLEFWEGTRC